MSDSNTISGYAIVFNTEAVIGDSFREKIAPGALDRTLRENPDVLALWSHDMNRILGRVSAGTLRLQKDRAGLYFNLDADPNTPDGQTALGTVRRRDAKSMSFGFFVRAEEWEDGGDMLPLRTVTDLDLLEISIVGIPAFDTTSADILGRAGSATFKEDHDRAAAKMRARGIAV